MIHWSSKKITIIVILSVFIIPTAYNVLNRNNLGINIDKDVINPSSLAIPEIDINSALPTINYQELNNLWYNQKVEMLIVINDSSYLDAVTPLVEWKNYKGVKTLVLFNYSDYEGRDKAEKIRNMIKSYYDSDNIRWVLLAGDAEESLIPTRYVYNPDTAQFANEHESLGNEYYKPTDFYYADLTGTWDDNNNNIFGESATNTKSKDEISWIPEVYVGRLPAKNPLELSYMINKTLDYEKAVNAGSWMNKMLLAGGISDPITQYDPDGEDESILTTYIWQNYTQYQMNFTHLWRSVYYTPPDPKEPLTATSFRARINEGYSTVMFAGHGSYSDYSDKLGNIYSNTDASNILNTGEPSLIYADACTTSPFDLENFDNNIGEILIKKENGGAIGYIGGMRVTWYFTDDVNLEKLNRGNAKLFWQEFFEENKFQQGKALYDSKIAYLNSDYFNQPSVSTEQEWERKNLLTYCLLGDPEVDIYTNTPVSATNPFTSTIYEGQLISLQIKDVNNNSVPYGRINFRSEDGKNRTVYADKNGYFKFRLPAQSNENYSVLITGHNLTPSLYSFITYPDTDQPVIYNVTRDSTVPSISNNIIFSINAKDNQSGIESVFVLLSSNYFKDYTIYKASNAFQENYFNFDLRLSKLKPGNYSYICVARDYSNKTTIFYDNSCNFIIQKPFSDWALFLSIIMIIGLASLSTVILLGNLKKTRRDIT